MERVLGTLTILILCVSTTWAGAPQQTPAVSPYDDGRVLSDRSVKAGEVLGGGPSRGITIGVFASSAPNAYGSPSWSGYMARALYALENGLAGNGDRLTDPNAYERAAAYVPGGEIAVTSFNSWRGTVNPPAPFASELGNRMHFGLHAVGDGTSQFALNDLTFALHSSDPWDSLVFVGDFVGYGYNGTSRYGINWGLNRVKGGGDDIVYTSGNGTTLVDEIVYVGVGNAWWPSDPDPQTAMDDYFAWLASVGPIDVTCTYAFTGTGASGSGTVTIIPPPLTYTVSGCGPTEYPGPFPPPPGAPHLVDGLGYPGDEIELQTYTGTLSLVPGTYTQKINTRAWSISYTYAGTDCDWTNDASGDWLELQFPVHSARTMSFGTGPGETSSLSQTGLLEVNWDNDYLGFSAGSTRAFFVPGYKINVTPLAVPRTGGSSFPGFPGGTPWVQPAQDVMATFEVINLTSPGRLLLVPDKACYQVDDTVTVELWMYNVPETIVGGQFFLQYDTSKLTFVSATPTSPFEDLYLVFPGTGLIDYAVQIPPTGSTTGDAEMAVLEFTAAAEICTETNLITWRAHDPPTRLSDEQGQPVYPALVNMDVIDDEPPTIACPSDVTIECDESTDPTNINVVVTMPFDTDPILSATQAPGVWYTDRYPPFGFVSSFFDGDNRLKHSIDASDCSLCRGGSYSSPFYDTQGRKYDIPGTTALRIDLYVPADWASTGRRMAGLWGTGFDSGGIVSAYPIIEFTSTPDGSGVPRFRAYDSNTGLWYDMGLPLGFAYDAWYTLEIQLVGSNWMYKVGDLQWSFADPYSVELGNVILQGHNTTAGVTYDIYWDNVVAGTSVFNTGVAAAADNCDAAPVITYTDVVGLCDCGDYSGAITRTWRATDHCGNFSECVQTITVVDTTAPTATQGTIDACYPDAASADAAALAATTDLTDNCDSTPDKTVQTGAGSCDTSIVIRVADDCDNYTDYTYNTRVDGTAPVVTAGADIDVDADAGLCTAQVTWSAASANDDCDGDISLSVVYDIDLGNDGSVDATQGGTTYTFPGGTHKVTARATDICGNTGSDFFVVTVSGDSELVVDINLANMGASGTLTRCITFELWECGTPSSQTVDEDITFINGSATNVTVLVPCGNYTCITARDKLHTLRRTIDPLPTIGTQYVADFSTAGKDLIGGNLNDDSWIDILDFGVFSWQWNTSYDGDGDTYPDGHTPCGVFTVHADINALSPTGNFLVESGDFGFIQANFLLGNEANCCGQPGLGEGEGPITRISIAELQAMGLAELAVGDLNADGWLDEADVVAFLNGVRPQPQPAVEQAKPVEQPVAPIRHRP